MLGQTVIVGRPNVGKSTIFNCLTQSTKALVDNRPGVTRDRIYGLVPSEDEEKDFSFVVIDTGGFETKDYSFQPFQENLVWKQTQSAVEEADNIVFVMDGKVGVQPHDFLIAQYLRTTKKKVFYVINKTDKKDEDAIKSDFYEIGTSDFICTTASHNSGIEELKEILIGHLTESKPAKKAAAKENQIRVAIVGRPNTGKSSLLNRLIGSERSIVSGVAGTTRDQVDATLQYDGKEFVFVDTAGIKRRSKVHDKIDVVSMMRSLQAIQDSHIVLLVIDASEGLGDQEAKLAYLATESQKPLVVVVNKWDLVENKTSKTSKAYETAVLHKLSLMDYVPVHFISCLTNQRVHKTLEICAELFDLSGMRASTSKLNAALERIVADHTPSLIKQYSKRVKFYFATQVKTHPPTIIVFTNVAEEIQESYKRYMHHKFREYLGFEKVPLRLIFRGKKEKE